MATPKLIVGVWPDKDPDSVRPYGFDWSAFLAGLSDTISTSVWTVVPTGELAVDSDTNTTTTTTVWLSAGTAGGVYRLTNRITTAGGATFDRSAKLNVKER